MSNPLRIFLALCACAVAAAGQPAPVAVPRLTHLGAGQTIYFVLTDRFANGRTDNDRGGYAGGPDETGFDPTRISHYHGGDFAGLTARLDYLKNLGITAVWVTPPFKNKAMQRGSAGYHGYWVLDFLHVDPHLGTGEEFRELIRQAHARGLRVFMDIIVNHTADVIQLAGDSAYRDKQGFPYRDAQGHPFDATAVAFNGLNDPAIFPALSAARSFPYVPSVPAAEVKAKNPDWLNEVTLYHNRGNSTFQGESATDGDFSGLDDLFTEHPRVVQGFIEVFSHWLRDFGVDGFRIDTAKHVNGEFWQAFVPAIRAEAVRIGRPDFIEFGEVYSEAGDPAYLSEFSTALPLDATLDFGFFAAARKFISQGGTGAELAGFFARDDYYTDHDSNVHSTPTFLGNHDAGRFAYFLQQDNPGASSAQLADLVRLGHGLLLLARGQPVLYYGDEQGMIGRGGGDMQAREDMFAAQAPAFAPAALLGTDRTGPDDKFDAGHPFYRFFSRLTALRARHGALRTGAMIPRATSAPEMFAFSRIERTELVEYLVVLNNARQSTLTSRLATGQPAGARLQQIFASATPDNPASSELTADAGGEVAITLGPLQFGVWRATAALPAPRAAPAIVFATPAAGAALTFTSHEIDGQTFPSRRELRAEVTGGDGVAEVTFTLTRASRPGQYELLGTDDTPPYRIFWRPPPDLAPDEKLTFLATVNDLRGHEAATEVSDVTVAATGVNFGIRGAKVPRILRGPPRKIAAAPGQSVTLAVGVDGTGPFEYQWLYNDEFLPGATGPSLSFPAAASRAGTFRVLIRNRAGTTLSELTALQVGAAPTPP